MSTIPPESRCQLRRPDEPRCGAPTYAVVDTEYGPRRACQRHAVAVMLGDPIETRTGVSEAA